MVFPGSCELAMSIAGKGEELIGLKAFMISEPLARAGKRLFAI